MKVAPFVSVLFISAFVMYAETSNKVGDCSFTIYTQKERVCSTAFIRRLQKQPSISCSPNLQEFFNCTIKIIKGCVKMLDAAGEAAVRAELEKAAVEKNMCELAGKYNPVPVGPNQTFPCTLSKDEYKNQTESCYGNFDKMWQNNRNDKSLCSEYGMAKKCIQKIMTAKCEITGDFKERADLFFDSYNPFCVEDPTSKSTDANSITLVKMAISIAVLLTLIF